MRKEIPYKRDLKSKSAKIIRNRKVLSTYNCLETSLSIIAYNLRSKKLVNKLMTRGANQKYFKN